MESWLEVALGRVMQGSEEVFRIVGGVLEALAASPNYFWKILDGFWTQTYSLVIQSRSNNNGQLWWHFGYEFRFVFDRCVLCLDVDFVLAFQLYERTHRMLGHLIKMVSINYELSLPRKTIPETIKLGVGTWVLCFQRLEEWKRKVVVGSAGQCSRQQVFQ